MNVWESSGDVDLSEICLWCLQNCDVDTLLFANRQSFGASERGQYQRGIDATASKLLGNKLILCFEATGWPGTELINHKGRVYVSDFDARLATKMAKVQNSFFNWQHEDPNELPEDLCLFRRGAELPTLISVTHERDAWVIAENCPTGFTASTYAPEDLYIWDGEYFCRI